MGEEVAGIQVWDNDGDFLLIEAAYVLPEWVQPNIMRNRVWIKQGQVRLIVLDKLKQSPDFLIRERALQAVKEDDSTVLQFAPRIQQQIVKKLSEYPEKAIQNVHKGVCCIPQKLARLIHKFPWSVSLAVNALCERDEFDSKQVENMPLFSPLNQHVVTVPVKFNRYSFAKAVTHDLLEPYLTSQNTTAEQDSRFRAIQLGMKITLGYEVLVNQQLREYKNSKFNNQTPISEVMLVHLTKQLSRHPYWKEYVSSNSNCQDMELIEGYLKKFGDVLKGRSRWVLFCRTLEICESNKERKLEVKECDVEDGDDESWLREGMDELEKELKGCENERSSEKKSQQENLDAEELAKKLEDFMQTTSGFEGVEEMQDLQFDPEEFLKELEKGLNGEVESSEGESQETQEDPNDQEVQTGTDSDDEDGVEFDAQYDRAMRQELEDSKAGLGSVGGPSSDQVKNFVQSMNEEGCSFGPATALATILGLQSNSEVGQRKGQQNS